MKWIDRWRMFGTKVDSIGNSCCPLNTCHYTFSFLLHHMVAPLHQPSCLKRFTPPSRCFAIWLLLQLLNLFFMYFFVCPLTVKTRVCKNKSCFGGTFTIQIWFFCRDARTSSVIWPVIQLVLYFRGTGLWLRRSN